MDPAAELRAGGRYGLLYCLTTAAVVAVVWRSERAAAAVLVAGLVVGGLGDGGVRPGTGGGDSGAEPVVDTHVDVRARTPTERRALSVGLALAGFAAMVVLGSVVRTGPLSGRRRPRRSRSRTRRAPAGRAAPR